MRVGIAAPNLSDKELEYVIDAVKSTWISSKGKYVKRFEEEFAEYIGVNHALTTSSGTTALHLALVALGVSKNDEVILPTLTMIACANTIKQCNAKPVFVDSELMTGNINVHAIEDKITENTSAIMVPHLYGHPADMDPILEIADRYDLFIIEDAAEAHGAEYKQKKVGSIGDIGCFSCYGNKILTCGEGGMVTTNSKSLAESMESLRSQGYDKKKRKLLVHKEIGFNYRLTNVQAAIGLAQLERIDEFIKIHRDNARLYNSLLEDLRIVRTPIEMSWAKHVYWMYTIVLDSGYRRDTLMRRLEKRGIDTRAVFYPIHKQPPYQNDYTNESYPNADRLSLRGMNLPSGNATTEEEVRHVCEAIRELVG